MDSQSGTFLLLAAQALLGFIQILLVLIAGLGKRALDRIEAIQVKVMDEVQVTNGTVIRLEQAIKDHDRLDEERFDTLEQRLNREERRT